MDLVSRLKLYMDRKGIAISVFADNCRIPRPTMSQILNGRNKKISDELISKIHMAYPDLSVLWLMFGEGDMTTDSNIKISEGYFDQNSDISSSQHPDNTGDTTEPNAKYSDTNLLQSKSDGHITDVSDDLSFTDSQSLLSGGNLNGNKPTSIIDFDMKPSANSLIDDETPFADGHNIQLPPNANELNDTNDNTPHKSPSTESKNNNEISSGNFISCPSGKTITNIVVFYSDNSFQSFYPDGKPQ